MADWLAVSDGNKEPLSVDEFLTLADEADASDAYGTSDQGPSSLDDGLDLPAMHDHDEAKPLDDVLESLIDNEPDDGFDADDIEALDVEAFDLDALDVDTNDVDADDVDVDVDVDAFADLGDDDTMVDEDLTKAMAIPINDLADDSDDSDDSDDDTPLDGESITDDDDVVEDVEVAEDLLAGDDEAESHDAVDSDAVDESDEGDSDLDGDNEAVDLSDEGDGDNEAESNDLDNEDGSATEADTTDDVGVAAEARQTDQASPAKVDAATASTGDEPKSERAQPKTKVKGRSKTGRRLLLGAIAAYALLVVGWGIDVARHSGSAMRGVEIDGTPVGGMDRAELLAVADDKNQDLAARPVTIQVGGASVVSDPVSLGATVDADQMIQDALDTRRGTIFFLAPIKWFFNLFSSENVPISYVFDADETTTAAEEAVMSKLDAPVEPLIGLDGDELKAVEGAAGTTINPRELVGRLRPAVEDGEPYLIELEAVPAEPTLTFDEVEELTTRLNRQASEPITIQVLDDTTELQPEELRSLVELGADDDGAATWSIDEAALLEQLKPRFPTLGAEDQLAHFTIVDDKPLIVPASETVVCCEEGSAELLQNGIERALVGIDPDEEDDEEVSYRTITLQPIIVGADEGVAELESLGIIEEVSTFTTEHKCCANRVKNIQRFADLTQGYVIRPGEAFSLNGHVGRRTTEKGFFSDGAIANGQLVQNVGGGISQYATTFFNASFFAGIEFEEYQSHSLYFSRYPRGREATISWQRPDLRVFNNTPYGILVWNTYTSTSITVTFYSTKHLEVEAGDLRRSSDRFCSIYTTPRIITYEDGTQTEDSVYASYRPGEALDCNNKSTLPEEEQEKNTDDE